MQTLEEVRRHIEKIIQEKVDQLLCGNSNAPDCDLRRRKYIRNFDEEFIRISRLFQCLNPNEGSSIFEIGPGAGCLAFLCKELRGCSMYSIDRDHASYFGLMRELLGILCAEAHVLPRIPINFPRRFDMILATQITFSYSWTLQDHKFFVKDCLSNGVISTGELFLNFNRRCLDENSQIRFFYESIGGMNKETVRISNSALTKARLFGIKAAAHI